MTERDYVLGTHDEEVGRLGLQHRIWRSRALECWRRSGITAGSRVLDVGAGPGYATVDLAEIVGPGGEVVAVERSGRFVHTAREACRVRGLKNVQFLEMDLMQDALKVSGMDAAWCRWVASFVASPERLVETIASTLRIGGAAAFHEYVDYRTWRLAPKGPALESFVTEVMASWRAAGGEPDIGLELPRLLNDAGMRVRHLNPMVFVMSPADFEWQWPKAFVEVHLRRLIELKRVDDAWADAVRHELKRAEADPAAVMIAPLVLEIVAERVA
jgi:SAM-dependent methyltransferase